jgi:hypothetical protein
MHHGVNVRLDDVRRAQVELRIKDATLADHPRREAFTPTLRKLPGCGP